MALATASEDNPVSQSFEWLHAVLLEHMEPDMPREIYQTNVSTTPLCRFGALARPSRPAASDEDIDDTFVSNRRVCRNRYQGLMDVSVLREHSSWRRCRRWWSRGYGLAARI